MNQPQTTDNASRFEVRLTSDSHFGWLRTRLSVERTLMAWVRTAMSLIGFGFTIVQFFERLQDMKGAAPAARPEAPRYLGLALIFAGVCALIVSLWQYRELLRYLWSKPFLPLAGMEQHGIEQHQHRTPLVLVTMLLLLIGIFTFFAVLFRLA